MERHPHRELLLVWNPDDVLEGNNSGLAREIMTGGF
jgi:hypothetical protein